MTTTTAKKPRPARRRKAKAMTTETYQVANKSSDVQLPVVITKPTDTIIPLTSYVQDAKNRWKIHQYEFKALFKDIVWSYNKAKPYLDRVRNRISSKGS
tara:strand:+ start:118 stop:414 length:297 start_codon:yes stop_codon:yes gene_type:complete